MVSVLDQAYWLLAVEGGGMSAVPMRDGLPFKYIYLNINTKTICQSERELRGQVRGSHAILMFIPLMTEIVKYRNQVIVASGCNFTENEAIRLYRKLSGLTR